MINKKAGNNDKNSSYSPYTPMIPIYRAKFGACKKNTLTLMMLVFDFQILLLLSSLREKCCRG